MFTSGAAIASALAGSTAAHTPELVKHSSMDA
jgi:hypothetical protein